MAPGAPWLTTIATFLALILSGCVGGESKADDPAGASETPVGTVSAEGGVDQTGTIRGVVTDDELVPIKNATVAVKDTKLQVVTNDGGAFEFLQVPFANYTIFVQALGYQTGQKAARLDADRPEAELKFELVSLVIAEPYHTTNTWAGKMSCGLALVPWCGILDELNQDYGTPNPTNERWLFNWTIPGGVAPSNTVFELAWTASIPGTATEFALLGLSGFSNTVSGSSVLRMEIDGESWADDLKKDKNYKFQIGVYPELVDPVVDQRYDLHRSDFFVEPSPEGWSYLAK